MLKASTVNRSEQAEIDSYNRLYTEYNKIIFPTKDKDLKDEAKRMFAPWKKFFEEGPVLGVKDIEPKPKDREKPKLKNLSKSGPSSSILIPKRKR